MEAATASPGNPFDSPQPNLLIAPLDTAVHHRKQQAAAVGEVSPQPRPHDHIERDTETRSGAVGTENNPTEHYTSSAETIPMAEPQRQNSIPATSSQQQPDGFEDMGPALTQGVPLTNNLGAHSRSCCGVAAVECFVQIDNLVQIFDVGQLVPFAMRLLQATPESGAGCGACSRLMP